MSLRREVTKIVVRTKIIIDGTETPTVTTNTTTSMPNEIVTIKISIKMIPLIVIIMGNTGSTVEGKRNSISSSWLGKNQSKTLVLV